MIFSTKVYGIPCQCEVTEYKPPKAMVVYGSQIDQAYPREKGEFNFNLLDRKGYRAVWLEKHLKDNDHFRLAEEFEAARLADRYDIHF